MNTLDHKFKQKVAIEAETKREWGHARMAKETPNKDALNRFKRPAFSIKKTGEEASK